MRQDQYILKNMHKPPISITKVTKNANSIDLSEKITIDEKG